MRKWEYNSAVVAPVTPEALVKACNDLDAKGWEVVGGPAVIGLEGKTTMQNGILVQQPPTPAFLLLIRRELAGADGEHDLTFDGIVRGRG